MNRAVTGQFKQWQHQGLVVRNRHRFLIFQGTQLGLNGGYRRSSRAVDTTTEIQKIWLQIIIAPGFSSCLLRRRPSKSHRINQCSPAVSIARQLVRNASQE
jgi:hypothetical protein